MSKNLDVEGIYLGKSEIRLNSLDFFELAYPRRGELPAEFALFG
jgi:hypothetical protein